MSNQAQRAELAALLRTRRGQLARTELGLPVIGRVRTSGLRREEVASLSGVSLTWYTWIEQGRDVTPSRQVLSALARTLRLSSSEHEYVLSLVGYAPPVLGPPSAPEVAPGHVQRLLESLTGSPAFALDLNWGISGWNAAYAALYPNIASVAAEDRNLLWLVFTDPCVRELLPRWEADSRRLLAEFRAETGPRRGEPAVADLVDRLQASSAPFRDGWSSHGIEGFRSRERLFHHPEVGDLRLEHHRLACSDPSDLHVVIYTPVEDGSSPARLAELLHARGTTSDGLMGTMGT